MIPIQQSAQELNAFVDRVRSATRPSASTAVINLVSALCGSCPQFVSGSPEQRRLSQGGAAARGVTYTTVMTRYDELVTPYTSGFM